VAAIFGRVFGCSVFWGAGGDSMAQFSGGWTVWRVMGIHGHFLGWEFLGGEATEFTINGSNVTIDNTVASARELLGDG
jgi:hypothetical protein